MVTIAFDVDGTLIKHDGVFNQKMVELLLALSHSDRFNVWVWSGGGIPYAQQRLRDLGLQNANVAVVHKGRVGADICVDDEAVKLAGINLQIL